MRIVCCVVLTLLSSSILYSLEGAVSNQIAVVLPSDVNYFLDLNEELARLRIDIDAVKRLPIEQQRETYRVAIENLSRKAFWSGATIELSGAITSWERQSGFPASEIQGLVMNSYAEALVFELKKAFKYPPTSQHERASEVLARFGLAEVVTPDQIKLVDSMVNSGTPVSLNEPTTIEKLDRLPASFQNVLVEVLDLPTSEGASNLDVVVAWVNRAPSNEIRVKLFMRAIQIDADGVEKNSAEKKSFMTSQFLSSVKSAKLGPRAVCSLLKYIEFQDGQEVALAKETVKAINSALEQVPKVNKCLALNRTDSPSPFKTTRPKDLKFNPNNTSNSGGEEKNLAFSGCSLKEKLAQNRLTDVLETQIKAARLKIKQDYHGLGVFNGENPSCIFFVDLKKDVNGKFNLRIESKALGYFEPAKEFEFENEEKLWYFMRNPVFSSRKKSIPSVNATKYGSHTNTDRIDRRIKVERSKSAQVRSSQ